MEKRLISALLNVLRSDESVFTKTSALAKFHQDFGVGLVRGSTRIQFSPTDKTEIHVLLKSVAGVDAATTTVGDWNNITRTEALNLGFNEKLARGAVKRNRVSIKPLPGRVLRLNGQTIPGLPGAHLDVDWMRLGPIAHDSILLVENYECFNDLDQISIDFGQGVGPCNPLAIYRGDRHESRLDHVNAFLVATGLPIILFGDYDPASVVEAARTPGAVGMLVPTEIEQLMASHGRADLYRNQVGPAFNQLAHDPRRLIRELHGIIDASRKGLVHEVILATSGNLEYRALSD